MLRSAIQQLGDVNELSSFTVTVNVLNAAGGAETPSTLEWRLVCLETGNVLQDWDTLSYTQTHDVENNLIAVTATVSINGSLNEMQTASLGREKKSLVVASDRDVTEWNGEAQYTVVRLGARS